MNRSLIILPALFLLGVAAGVALVYERASDSASLPSQPSSAPEGFEHPMAGAFAVTPRSDPERIQAIEEQLRSLAERIDVIERGTAAAETDAGDGSTGALVVDSRSSADTPVSAQNPAVTTGALVKAGVAQDLAADIVRRRNAIDLQLLELRDRASREGYYGTERYLREVAALREKNPSLREEIGEDYYDSYLFATGQNNRVRVVSVMMGSPAEIAGMQDGDVILNYDNQRMFDWRELQEATAMGERDEYVNVTVFRNGQVHNLWIPRGPLGIRLGAVRVKP